MYKTHRIACNFEIKMAKKTFLIKAKNEIAQHEKQQHEHNEHCNTKSIFEISLMYNQAAGQIFRSLLQWPCREFL